LQVPERNVEGLSMFYYQHHIGDFIRDTGNLTDSQLAAYLRMMWIYYDTETPLYDDCESIAFKIRASETDVRLIAKHYFVSVDGFLRHKRCDSEIAEYHKKSATASAKAKLRWSNAAAMLQHSNSIAAESKSDANREPITNNQDKEKPTSAKSAISIKTYIENCKAEGVRSIPEDDSVFDFADKTGIPLEMVKVCWNRFVQTNTESGKRQKDWRKAFRNCVTGNWYKLWFIEADGSVKETSQYRALKKGIEDV